MDFREPIWTKLPGQHWRTFDRLLHEDEAAQQAYVALRYAAMAW